MNIHLLQIVESPEGIKTPISFAWETSLSEASARVLSGGRARGYAGEEEEFWDGHLLMYIVNLGPSLDPELPRPQSKQDPPALSRID